MIVIIFHDDRDNFSWWPWWRRWWWRYWYLEAKTEDEELKITSENRDDQLKKWKAGPTRGGRHSACGSRHLDWSHPSLLLKVQTIQCWHREEWGGEIINFGWLVWNSRIHRWKKFSGVEPFTPYYVAQVQKIHIAPVELKKIMLWRWQTMLKKGLKDQENGVLAEQRWMILSRNWTLFFLNQNLRYIGRVQVYLNQEDSACSRVSRFTFTFLL